MRAWPILTLLFTTTAAFAQTAAPRVMAPSQSVVAVVPVVPAVPAVIDRALVQRQLETLQQQLAVVQSQLETEPAQVGPALAQLRASQHQLDRLARSLLSAPPANPTLTPPPPPPAPIVQSAPPRPHPMSDARLAALLEAIRNESFSSEQLGVLRTAAADNLFTVAQAQQILPLYTFSADRIAALKELAPRLVDRANAFRLCDSFTFSTDKDQARKILTR